ncbi:polysaccharide deacetylase [Pedobacter sp. L105]|uniref:polysaccharide deacetylase family protein n=1 Tax=Pedobacter sp. L105 TaxID=1641871 RepID=UPI00131DF3BA|nr:polysaccharide deacetylase [Pedobacter sp. L105]
MNRYNIIVNRLSAGILSCFLLFFISTFCTAQEVVKNYSIYTGVAKVQGKELLLLRKMEKSGQLTYLAVDPQTLSTQLLPASVAVAVKQMNWVATQTYFQNTPYFRALSAAGKQSLALQDAGITRGYPKEKGITLTIDLCPSHKPLDRIIFTSLIAEFKKIEQPVPVAISITGRWMLTHTDDLNWLKELVAKKEIDITWTDHTFNHHFSLTAPLKTNFLLEPGTDLNFEILGTELAMLQHGLLPSVFFRFPGLVSDQRVVDKVLSYGIIPIGSDAWLAKGQQAAPGSIVLIHGNGNEEIGVNDFIKLLKSKSADIMGKQWMMYDLSESVEDEFSTQ